LITEYNKTVFKQTEECCSVRFNNFAMACVATMVHPSLSPMVEAGIVVRGGDGFYRDYGVGGIRPDELEDANIFAELSMACGLMDDSFWEQIDEIELDLGESASSLNEKMMKEEEFMKEMDELMEEKEEEECILDVNSPGYKMMKAMGWENNTPLGCRGEGILHPVSSMIQIREAGDVSGIGYEKKERPEVGEKDKQVVKIIRLEKNYAVGNCERGGVYIPRGAMNHLRNLMGNNLIGSSFSGGVISKEGRFEWRVTHVDEIV